MAKKALITGITGQDGSYLAEFLLGKGYEVFGIVRRTSSENYERIAHIKGQITLLSGDLLDQTSLDKAVSIAYPDEVYNLAAQSFVPASFEQPTLTAEINAVGVARLLDAIRRQAPHARFYQASTSEMFGRVRESPQSENTPFYPRSPYAVSKVYAHYLTINYRESYNMHASSGICFNHESERRGLEFVTRKITDGVARCKLGLQNKLVLGNVEACRDWGFAGDYVRAMWLMLQQSEPDDYVIATGQVHSVIDFVGYAFDVAGLRWEDYVVEDPTFYRPAEVEYLMGNANKAHAKLGWFPECSFHDLVARMVEHDLRRIGRDGK